MINPQTDTVRKASRRAMQRTAFLLVSAMALMGVCSVAGAQNLIQNPGFELNPPTGFGNHIGYPITPWILTGAGQSNVVKVDGGAAYNYGTPGPALDADPATGVGVVQHYLDIANAANDFYQTFTVPSCGGAVQGQTVQLAFSGAFSTRDNRAATGSIRIREGTGVAGAQLAVATASLPAPVAPQTSSNAPWVTVSGTVNVAAGSVVSYIVSMNDFANFDQASMTFSTLTCTSAQLTLRKTWAAAVVNDGATVTVSRSGAVADSLVSVANTANETDTDATPLTVYNGETLPLAETLNAGNGGLYNGVVACTGNGAVSGGAVVVGSTGGAVVCTYTNTRRSADLSITKTNTPAAGASDQAADTVVSGAATTYQIVVTNGGVDPVTGAVVRDTPGAGITCPTTNAVTCTSTATPSACPAGPLTVAGLQTGVTLGTLPSAAGTNTTTFTFSCNVQ